MTPGLRDWAIRDPERPALLIDGQSVVTYAALEARSNRFAHMIRAQGLGRTDHIAALVGNSADIIALCWAAWRTGVYLTPIPTRLSPAETAYVVENSTARMVFLTPEYAAQIADVDAALCVVVNGAAPGRPSAEPRLAALPTTPIMDEIPGGLMLYSSGTTGAPKGIVRPLLAPEHIHDIPPFARDLIPLFGLSPDTRYLSTQPLYHAAALRFVLAMTAVGAFSVVQPKFDAARALALIDAHDITHSQWVPTMFRRLLALPPETRAAFVGANHQTALHGAAPCAPTLKRAMIDWWGPILTEYYSGTEGVGLTLINSTDWMTHPGSVGRAVKGNVQVLGPDDTPLPSNETGRIFFSGIPPFSYFDAPEKTAGKTSAQGWQTFGDIGMVDPDGYLFLSDRADDMIISGGVNLYPQEIENAIESADFVSACGVVGVPDPEFEERPVAFVVLTSDAPADPIAALAAHLDTRLGRVKHPRNIFVVEQLPVTETGKLLRRALRELIAD